jgi:hypothetical protein
MSTPARRHPVLSALRPPAVWRRAAPIGLPVGLLQVAANQGDHRLRLRLTASVLLKSIVSPLLSFGNALASAVATRSAELRRAASRP